MRKNFIKNKVGLSIKQKKATRAITQKRNIFVLFVSDQGDCSGHWEREFVNLLIYLFSQGREEMEKSRPEGGCRRPPS